VKNQLRLNGQRVDLNNITMPLLSLVATYDHLVPPESSRGFNDLCPSKDKKMMEFPTGHIGLSVSSAIHKKMWPEVALWLEKRSHLKQVELPEKTVKRKKGKTAQPEREFIGCTIQNMEQYARVRGKRSRIDQK
jgi:polyhydroxyalkanoate synthase